jgi:hypothetical protein
MPSALWDIHPQCQEPLECNLNLRVLEWEVIFDDNTKQVEHVYFIQPANSSDDLTVMLHDAAAVLECYCQFKTLVEIITFLFSNGRPCHTLVPQKHISPASPLCVQLSPMLGYYPKNYKPSLWEYRYYEQLHQDFCKLPRARAALTRGGIIWRLTLESIGAPADEIVSDGPSQEVLTHGTSIQDAQSSEVMQDNELTEAEKDLMCGVYKVFTSE